MKRIKNRTIEGVTVIYKQLETVLLKVRAINHQLRTDILEVLKDKEMTVTQVFIHFRLEQSVASQHLAILRRAGLVYTRREGKFIYYRTNEEALNNLLEFCREITAISKLRRSIDNAYFIMRTLRHSLRLDILEFISDKSSTIVGNIYRNLNLEQSITSNHLADLLDIGVVENDKVGKFVYYNVNKKVLGSLIKKIQEVSLTKVNN